MRSFHTAVHVGYALWAVAFIGAGGIFTDTRIMTSDEFIEMIKGEAERDEESLFSVDDREQSHKM